MSTKNGNMLSIENIQTPSFFELVYFILLFLYQIKYYNEAVTNQYYCGR